MKETEQLDVLRPWESTWHSGSTETKEEPELELPGLLKGSWKHTTDCWARMERSRISIKKRRQIKIKKAEGRRCGCLRESREVETGP